MIKSMTAFAEGEVFVPPIRVIIELKSYNNRYLDVLLKVTPGYRSVEKSVRRIVKDKICRGRVEVFVQIEDQSDDLFKYKVDISKARALFKSLTLLDRTFGLGGIDLGMLINSGKVVYPVRKEKVNSKILDLVDSSLVSTIAEMNKMKLAEGENIAQDLEKRLGGIEDALMEVRRRASNLPQFYRDKLKERFEKLTKGLIDFGEDRLLQEVSIMASKSDITEEIVRAQSHIKQFRTIMENECYAGKKLNFLIQELNREVNTMSSKMSVIDISYMVISIKSELEKIREQVQNVE